jgi:Zn-dependent peptidase ImmA (M78 family)
VTDLPRFAAAVCRAREIITELQIQKPSEIAIESIAPFKNAPVRYAELVGCDGRMVRLRDQAIITVRSSIDRPGQRRVVIAHELGHVILHPHICQMDQVDVEQTRNFNHHQRPEELEANYFASELLMPRKLFKSDAERHEPSWDGVTALAKLYQTTLCSAAIQYLHTTNQAVVLIASKNGERAWYVIGEHARDFYISPTTKIHHYTCAHELLSRNKTRSRAENIAAGAWFNGYAENDKVFVVEDSIRATGSDFVLSLVWIRDDI